MFLAIAVDNLATAQALTRDEEREQKARELAKKRIKEKRQRGWMKAKKQLPVVLTFKNLSNFRSSRLVFDEISMRTWSKMSCRNSLTPKCLRNCEQFIYLFPIFLFTRPSDQQRKGNGNSIEVGIAYIHSI